MQNKDTKRLHRTEDDPVVISETIAKITNNDPVEESSHAETDRKLTPVRIFFGIIAFILTIGGLVWIGEVFGIFTALVPGGLHLFGGWVWGVLGLGGLAVLIWIVYNTWISDT